MGTNKSYLPEPGTKEAEELIHRYQVCSQGELEGLQKEFGYKNIDNFREAMRRRLGITRGGVTPTGLVKPNIPLRLKTGTEPVTSAWINDTHNPYQDPEALELAEIIIAKVQPELLVYPGDVNDFYQISKFDKDPGRVDEMQGDIDSTKAMFRRHKKRFPSVKRRILLGGNHEDRWQKFLWTSASALSSLKCLTIEELFGLEEFGIEYIPYECGLMINDLFLGLHGDIASIHSGYTAKRMYEKHGGCGICGHCHRGGSFYKRDRFGFWGWWENFCLCSLNPDWIKNPNWIQGFSLVHFQGRRFWVEQIPITDKACMYGGKKYEV